MLLAYKIEPLSNESQKEYLNKTYGTIRHCYNQLLDHFSKDISNVCDSQIRVIFSRMRMSV